MTWQKLRQPQESASCWRDAATAMHDAGDHDAATHFEQLAASADQEKDHVFHGALGLAGYKSKIIRPDRREGIMSGEAASLAAEMAPYVSAAVGAYGGAVLVKVRDEAADATVGLGRRLLQRVFGSREEGEPTAQPHWYPAADPG